MVNIVRGICDIRERYIEQYITHVTGDYSYKKFIDLMCSHDVQTIVLNCAACYIYHAFKVGRALLKEQQV